MRKYLLVLGLTLAAGAVGYWLGKAATVQAAGGRVYELRTYTTNEGKMDALHARFRDHTMEIFKKHGMTNVAYFSPTDEPLSKNTLIYLLSFPSREAANKSWADFGSDPEWKKVAAESEANGKIVNHVERVFMQPTDYSPMK